MLKISLSHRLEDFYLQLDVDIPHQGVTAIFGRSGAGKSSLINVIAGLSQPTSGHISLNARCLFDRQLNINVPIEKRRIGYVFQEHRLFPHYRVEGNLRYGIKRFDLAKFSTIVDLLGLRDLLDRFPASLSGGERQRVAIGRALLSEPDMLLMDEPLSALDLPRKQELLDYLAKLAKTLPIPILYVSHSLDEIVRLSDRLLLLEKGKMIAFDQTVKVWNSPAFAQWQPHSQRLSLLELPIIEREPRYKMMALAIGEQKIWLGDQSRYQIGDKLRINIASREVSLTLEKPNLTSIRNILFGHVCEIEKRNDRIDIAVEIAKMKIWASISFWSFDLLHIQLGQAIYLQIKSVSL